jgi:phospholipid/cholesterol/gamma-HCH transport system substrate-binding protein
MNERILQFRVGAMILATAMIAVILVLLFMGTSPGLNGTYTIYVRFSDAPGVSKNTPVRKSGIRIGRVTDVRFTEDDTAVIATLEIDRDRKLYDNEYCQAVSSLLIGDAALEFVRGPEAAPRKPILAGETIQGHLAMDPTRGIDSLKQELAQTMNTVDTAGRDMHNVLGRLDRLIEMNEQRINRVVGEADQTLQSLQLAINNANDILGDQQLREQIKQTVAELPQVVRQARTTVEKAGVAVDKAGAAIDKVGGTLDKANEAVVSLDENLKNLEGLTKPLGEKGEELVSRLDEGVGRFDDLMAQLQDFSKGLNDPNGTISMLVHSPDLYNRVNHIARNVETITLELQPILDDARTFSDKIARDPGVLGVRGVLEKNNHLKGKPAPYDRDRTMEEQINSYDSQ